MYLNTWICVFVFDVIYSVLLEYSYNQLSLVTVIFSPIYIYIYIYING